MHASAPITRPIVGVIPAAGWARRLEPLPFSKELFPIGFHRIGDNRARRPKVAAQYLLERLHLAGINTAFIVLRDGKWDIPGYFRDGHTLNMNLAYLMMRTPHGVPFSVDQAYPFVNNAIVALGFPDIIFYPKDAFSHLLDKQQSTGADVVLGLSPIADSKNWDMVDTTEDGHILRIYIKQSHIKTPYGWFIAVWSPVFTHFMHEYLASHERQCQTELAEDSRSPTALELHMGDVIQGAIEKGLSIDSVLFQNGTCLDIGIPENLINIVGDRNFDFLTCDDEK